MSEIQAKAIQQGVKELRKFGYPKCNAENILTDEIYSSFFRSILEGTIEDEDCPRRVKDELTELVRKLPEKINR